MTASQDQTESSPDPAAGPTMWGKFKRRATYEALALGNAFAASWGRVLLGLLFGYICFGLHARLRQPPYDELAKLFEHFGVAFFVAAIVVFGYEWKSDRKALLEAINAMTGVLDAQRIEGAMRCIREAFFSEKDALQTSLGVSLQKLIKETHDLVSKNAWSREISIGLVGALIASATENAHKFARPDDETGFTIELPSPPKLVNKMLETQMSSMRAGGTYEVISDFTSFQKQQLKDFMRETKERVNNGVEVRRIFACFDHDFELPLEEMERIIADQWSAVTESNGKYIVGFIPPTRGGIEPQHEGVFTQGELKIRFRPKAPDLRVMEFFRDRTAEIAEAFEKLAKLAVFAAVDSDSQTARTTYLSAVRKVWRKGKKSNAGARRS